MNLLWICSLKNKMMDVTEIYIFCNHSEEEGGPGPAPPGPLGRPHHHRQPAGKLSSPCTRWNFAQYSDEAPALTFMLEVFFLHLVATCKRCRAQPCPHSRHCAGQGYRRCAIRMVLAWPGPTAPCSRIPTPTLWTPTRMLSGLCEQWSNIMLTCGAWQ